MITINEQSQYIISVDGRVFCQDSMFFDVPTDFLKAFYDLLRPYPNNKHSVSVVVAEDDENGPVFVFARYPFNQCTYVIDSRNFKDIIKIEQSHIDLAKQLIENIEKQYDLFLQQYRTQEAKEQFLESLHNLKSVIE